MCCCEHALALARVKAEEEFLRASRGEAGVATAVPYENTPTALSAGVLFCQMWWERLTTRRRS